MTIVSARASPPLHLWVVGVVSLLWNMFGCVDYTMMRLHNAGWLATMHVSATMVRQVDAAPLWGAIGWALGVWGSLAGSLLLLARSRHAAIAFLVSFLGALVGFGWQVSAGVMASPALPVMIELIVLALWWYARAQIRRGSLR